MVELGIKSSEGVSISSMCTVFIESEVVSLIAEGYSKEKIIKGLMDAVSIRTVGMADQINVERPIAMTGGVAKNSGILKSLSERFESDIYVPDEPQIIHYRICTIKFIHMICLKKLQGSLG